MSNYGLGRTAQHGCSMLPFLPDVDIAVGLDCESLNPSPNLFQTAFSPRFSRFARSTTRHPHPRKFMSTSPILLVVSRKSQVLHASTRGLGAALWMTAIAAEASVPWRGSLNWKKGKRCYGCWTGSGLYWGCKSVQRIWYHKLFVYRSSLHPQHVWIDGHVAITPTTTSCRSTFWMQAPELKVLMFLMWEAWHLQNSCFHSLAVLKGRLRWKLWTSKMLPNVHFGYLAAFCRWCLWSRKMNRRSVHLGYKATQIFGNLDNLAKSPNLRGWNASSSYVQDLWTSVSVPLVSLAFVFEDPTGSLTRSESIRIKAAWHRFSARWKKQRNSIAV